MLDASANRLREISRKRALRWGATSIFLGLLGAVTLHATQTWFRPWWVIAANGQDDQGHRVVAAPTSIFDECRNIVVVWPGLAALIVAFVVLLLVAVFLVNDMGRRWAEGHEPGRGSFVLLGGVLGLAGLAAGMVASMFLLIPLP